MAENEFGPVTNVVPFEGVRKSQNNKFNDNTVSVNKDAISGVSLSGVTYNTGPEERASMDDKDVMRLEDRITASEDRSQMRLEIAMTKVEATLNRISDQNAALAVSLAGSRAQVSTWGQWIIGTIVAAAIAFGGLAVGLKQVWIGGVQVGQGAQGQATTNTRSP